MAQCLAISSIRPGQRVWSLSDAIYTAYYTYTLLPASRLRNAPGALHSHSLSPHVGSATLLCTILILFILDRIPVLFFRRRPTMSQLFRSMLTLTAGSGPTKSRRSVHGRAVAKKVGAARMSRHRSEGKGSSVHKLVDLADMLITRDSAVGDAVDMPDPRRRGR